MTGMKLITILLLAAFLALTIACGEQEQPATQQEAKTTAEDVKQEAKELAETTKEYTMEQKQAYEQQLADKLDEYEQKLSTLKTQMVATQGEAKQMLQEKIDTLQANVADMRSKVNELQDASGQAWMDLKDGLDKAGDDLDQAFTDAMQNFKKSSSSY